MKKWLIAFALLSACASKPPKAPGPSELLYPHGTYQHKVKVQIIQPSRTIDLRGVIKSQPDSLKVVGLSSFNTTVFRIDENLKTGEIQKEFYVDTIRRNEEKFMFFYQLLKELVLARKGQTEFDRQGAHFKVSAPDENGIYRKIEIKHEHVNLDIEVSGYEF
jgi:hypothetical protein